MFSLKVLGANRLLDILRRLASRFGKEVIDPAGQEWTKALASQLKSKGYPPERPGQKYVRTGQLANRWAVRQDGTGRWVITNQASRRGKLYAGFVVGDDQAWMHKGRWWKATDVAREELPKLERALGRRIEAIWES